jgi:hypothetical protein
MGELTAPHIECGAHGLQGVGVVDTMHSAGWEHFFLPIVFCCLRSPFLGLSSTKFVKIVRSNPPKRHSPRQHPAPDQLCGACLAALTALPCRVFELGNSLQPFRRLDAIVGECFPSGSHLEKHLPVLRKPRRVGKTAAFVLAAATLLI